MTVALYMSLDDVIKNIKKARPRRCLRDAGSARRLPNLSVNYFVTCSTEKFDAAGKREAVIAALQRYFLFSDVIQIRLSFNKEQSIIFKLLSNTLENIIFKKSLRQW
ncbi:unnamed protein product [Musa banksii]